MKRVENDLRNVSKQRLLELGLQKKVLQNERNDVNCELWGVTVTDDGEVITS